MSARPRRRKLEEHHEEENGERWMASYMDMVTVLLCMFIVLFAISSVNEGKYDQLRNSLAAGFGVTKVDANDPADSTVRVMPDTVYAKGQGTTDAEEVLSEVQRAVQEVDELDELKEQIRAALANRGLADSVRFVIDQRGLTVRLVGTETFFETSSAILTAQAGQILDAVSPTLVKADHDISVEGHADYRKSIYPYPSNWELSADRAVHVLRHLVEQGGVPQQRIAAVGFGSARPIATGTSPQELAANRRVDIVVLSKESDAVRALLPKIVDKTVHLDSAGRPTS
ncbi:flagellar motor protein MotB [Parafrigoribacterium mesophilum]|uniref:flagellar motor protein MotB n=1 Tax=Parafrigoribacterium mesophilum TaxID=433646 RepID=UPI0031FCD1E8